MAADGRIDRAGVLAQIAADDGLIRAGHGVVGQLCREGEVRKVVFRRDEQTGRVLVDAVHDAGPPLSADAGETVAAVGEQGVDERAVLVAGRGCTTMPRGLLTTMRSSSSYTTSSGRSCATSSEGAASGSVTTNVSPGAVL